ncbi:MAG: hypothetical protein MUE52_09570 [Tabrizicola sp.]|jgi:hypothetical protein|nr:hypothetical protein [Tabrizicola sp.]
MSEYTDYFIYRTDAQEVEELRSEVADLVRSGMIISGPYSDGTMGADALGAQLRQPGPAWVALLTPTAFDKLAATPVAQIYVLEDFASWRLDVRCENTVDVFQFGTDDNYALEWFGYNFSAPFVTGAIEPATLDRLAGCFAVPSEALGPVLAYGKVWDFLTLTGAPSVQMLDQSIALFDLEATAPAKVVFDWELW